MARVSEKALRPRQYVFNRLPADRIVQLRPGVQKLMEAERAAAASARAAETAREASEAKRHAENILAGVQAPDPESDEIRALEKELEELKEKKKVLFAQLKKQLKTECEPMEVDSVSPSIVKQEALIEKEKTTDKKQERIGQSGSEELWGAIR